MSRIGKLPISVEKDVKILINGNIVHVEGPVDAYDFYLPKGVKINQSEKEITLEPLSEGDKSKLGLVRSLIQNAVTGVKKQWSKTLELVGVGFRAQTTGSELVLNLGFSHPIKMLAPKGINFKVEENKITVLGMDKYLVGEVAASIRRLKKPEPYKGKGIRYQGEHIRKKVGKAAKAVGAATK